MARAYRVRTNDPLSFPLASEPDAVGGSRPPGNDAALYSSRHESKTNFRFASTLDQRYLILSAHRWKHRDAT